MTIIEQIKAEIERRITDNTFGAKLELIDILTWLDTLESEKPINPEELEKEAVSYCFDNGLNLSPRVATDFARHFAQWGANHANDESEKPVPNDAEEAAKEYARCHYADTFSQELAENDFIAGSAWKEVQMMKEAVEATLDNTAYPTRLWFNTYLSEYSNNDKVRIIIVKED